jgi:hypothetical protein
MNGKRALMFCLTLVFMSVSISSALERPGKEFKIFQFPKNMIPCIDGNPNDWIIVPDSYSIGMDELKDTNNNSPIDKKDLDVNVKVGWVKGMNQLYFLVEVYDDYWFFAGPTSNNDIFELVVDGDLSGGPFIPGVAGHKEIGKWEGYSDFQGVHAQNYHVNIPAADKSWAMVWGCQPWANELPWANGEYSYNFKHGESGKLIVEFWITPFDFAPYEGPGRAVISKLEVNKIIGMSWALIDYDNHEKSDSFFNLSHKSTMYGDASDLVAFRLMPLEEKFVKPIAAEWSFKIVDEDMRIVAFKDESAGRITKWHWEFGDGTTSEEQNPIHEYFNGKGYYTSTVLTVEGPAGKSSMSKPWDVAIKNPKD